MGGYSLTTNFTAVVGMRETLVLAILYKIHTCLSC